VGIASTAFEDLYVIPKEVDLESGSERVTFEAKALPLVPWIWYGGLIVTVGALIGLWPAATVAAPAAARRRSRPGPLPAPAG